ncbi:Uncharacterised protein [uncultured archaeon]|nr:Uncharacterised protein [uncultured archaeon]
MTDMIKLGFTLILAGFALLFMASLLSAGKVDFGGLIMIGPVPIAFGTSPEITVIAMVTGLAMMLVFFMLRRKYA